MPSSGSNTKKSILESIDILDGIFNHLGDYENYRFTNASQIFTLYPDDASTTTLNTMLTSNRFVVSKERKQMLIEVYYEPYLYDIELSLFSVDATRVRSHLYGELAQAPKLDLTLFTGSKRLFVELEPGTYEVRFMLKILPNVGNSEEALRRL